MPTWPATLPQAMLAGTSSETGPENVIRTNMAVGPAKVRRRGTVSVKTISGTYAMTTAQVAILDTFFSDDIDDGALSFTWPGKYGEGSYTARIIPPVATSQLTTGLWELSINIEVLP